jgi:hypothetical protein
VLNSVFNDAFAKVSIVTIPCAPLLLNDALLPSNPECACDDPTRTTTVTTRPFPPSPSLSLSLAVLRPSP